MKERATFIADLWEQGSFFFEAPEEYDQKAMEKAVKPDTKALIEYVTELLANQQDFDSSSLSSTIKGWISSENISFGKVMMPLRLALVGEMKGPDVMEIISVLGKQESLARLRKFLAKI